MSITYVPMKEIMARFTGGWFHSSHGKEYYRRLAKGGWQTSDGVRVYFVASEVIVIKRTYSIHLIAAGVVYTVLTNLPNSKYANAYARRLANDYSCAFEARQDQLARQRQ